MMCVDMCVESAVGEGCLGQIDSKGRMEWNSDFWKWLTQSLDGQRRWRCEDGRWE